MRTQSLARRAQPSGGRGARALRPSSPCATPVDDAGLGYLVYAESAARQLPVVYLALKKWKHNKFWFDLRDERTRPDGHTVGVHKVTSSIQAHVLADAFLAHGAAADEWRCEDCRAGSWGWRGYADTPFGSAPRERFACCARAELAARA